MVVKVVAAIPIDGSLKQLQDALGNNHLTTVLKLLTIWPAYNNPAIRLLKLIE